MASSIGSVTTQPASIAAPPGTTRAVAGTAAGQPSFKEVLADSVRQLDAAQHDAETAVAALTAGENTSPDNVLAAVRKADLAFRMMIEIRDELMRMYREVQSIQV
ncbi:MAG: flagellar hook-basal body complex protein FliE [Planctomycetia bacterium]|nr:flagellar hook-basal body complex protein FliE [Planctomycetia bacterium]